MRFALALVLILTPAFAQEGPLGPDLTRIVESAGAIHVFAIEPERADDAVHVAGHPVRRVVALEAGQGLGRRLRGALLDAASWAEAPGDCFLPREAIRIRSAHGVATLLVSLECRAVRWVEGDRVIAAAPDGPLAKALEAALAGGEKGPEAADGDAASRLAELTKKYRLLEDVAREREEASIARVDQLYDDIKALQKREEQLAQDRDALKADRIELSSRLDDAVKLLDAMKIVFERTTEQLNEKTRLVEEMKRAGGAEAGSVERVREVLDETRAQLQAERARSADLAQENERLRAELARAREEPGPGPAPEAGPIDGAVSAVDGEAGLVMIDRGRAHGVTRGTVLTVFRGDEFIGRVLVEQVFPDASSARIDRAITTKTIQAGDLVTSRIR